MKQKTHAWWSFFIAVVLSAVFVWQALSRPLHQSLNWDGAGYYFYLPALFIYDDLALENRAWFEEMRVKYDLSGTLYQVHPVPERTSHVNQYTSGIALILAPAFAIAHVLAEPLGYTPDGFSAIYPITMSIWSIILAIAGIIAFRRMLLRFFPDQLSALLLILIFAGTNYMVQIPGNLVSPHNYLFLLFALFITAVVDWHLSYRPRHFYTMVVTGGLACLIRPTELIWIFIPVFWGCRSIGAAGTKIKSWFSAYSKVLVRSAFVLALLASPQVIYWLISTGRPFYMSYSNPGEGLDFTSPHTLDFLFSFRKGWFLYSPLMLIAVLGFIPMFRRKREWALGLLIFFLVNLYVVSSWTTWWYAQCFSQRVMIHSLPLMAVPLGFAIQWMGEGRFRSWSLGVGVAAIFGLSVFYQWQYLHYILHQDRMTKEYFLAVFGKTEVDPSVSELLLIERPFDGSMVFSDKAAYERTDSLVLSAFNAEALHLLRIDSLETMADSLGPDRQFSHAIKRPFREITASDHAWLELRTKVWLPEGANADDCLLVATAEHKGGVYGYRTTGVSPESFVPGAWNEIRMDYLTPEVRTTKDVINVYLWHRGSTIVYYGDITATIWQRKK